MRRAVNGGEHVQVVGITDKPLDIDSRRPRYRWSDVDEACDWQASCAPPIAKRCRSRYRRRPRARSETTQRPRGPAAASRRTSTPGTSHTRVGYFATYCLRSVAQARSTSRTGAQSQVMCARVRARWDSPTATRSWGLRARYSRTPQLKVAATIGIGRCEQAQDDFGGFRK